VKVALQLAVVLAAVLPAKAADQPVKKRKLGPRVTVQATAYAPCSSGGRTRDGSVPYWGVVASNRHRLGTLLRMDHLVNGRRYFRVRDTGGASMQLDVWMASCSAAVQFGRRRVSYRPVLP
jgi:3D (Asp-Asp-Asp) domain-containing protein